MSDRMTGDDEMDSVSDSVVESVGGGIVQTPEMKQRHADLLAEEADGTEQAAREAQPERGIDEDGIDITESDGPDIEAGDDLS